MLALHDEEMEVKCIVTIITMNKLRCFLNPSVLRRNFCSILKAGFIATVLFADTSAIAKEGDNSKTVAFTQAYVSFAFMGSDRLEKFLYSPRTVFVCAAATCRKTIDTVIQNLPKEAFTETSSEVLDYDIVVSFGHPKVDLDFEPMLKNDPNLKLRIWGDARCQVHQFRIGYEVKKLYISVDSNEGLKKNVTCVVFELRRGSGGRSPGTYDEYIYQVLRLDDISYQKFMDGNFFFLKYHWSTVVPPGASKEETYQKLIEIK
jgi:hypothetical protein